MILIISVPVWGLKSKPEHLTFLGPQPHALEGGKCTRYRIMRHSAFQFM